MITNTERVALVLAQLDMRVVDSIYAERVKAESKRQEGAARYLLDRGYEVVSVPPDDLLTQDGREVIRVAGQAWALKPDVHAQRLAEAFEQAKQRDMALKQAKHNEAETQPSTCLALIDGQLCGGTLVRASVCPRCALGKSGVAATLTCDVCGHVTAVMRGES